MHQSPKVSVIMPVYNTSKYLNEALNSILNQTFTDFEFIIIDDASTDGSKEIIKSFTDERIILIENELNKGYVFGLNYALSIARGELIARMDSDDISNMNRLEIQFNYLKENQKIMLCGTYYELMNNKEIIKHPVEHDDIIKGLFWGSVFCHSSVMFRKSFLTQNMLLYNPKMEPSEDYDLWTRMVQIAGAKFANIPEILISYRVHNQQVSQTKQFLQNRNSLKIRLSYLNWYLGPDNDMKLNIESFDQNDLNYLLEIQLGLEKLINAELIINNGLKHVIIETIERINKYIIESPENFNLKSLSILLVKNKKVLLNQPKKEILKYLIKVFFNKLF